MNELLNKIKLYEEQLDKNKDIKRIKELNELIRKDKDLNKKILEYQVTKDPSLKMEIYNNELYKEYKSLETNINLIIMSLNAKLKVIRDKGCGHNENN